MLVFEFIVNIFHTIIWIYIKPLDLILMVHEFYSFSNESIFYFSILTFLRLLLFRLFFGARVAMAMERQTTRKNNWSDTFFWIEKNIFQFKKCEFKVIVIWTANTSDIALNSKIFQFWWFFKLNLYELQI